MKKIKFYNISKLNKNYEKIFIKNFRLINNSGKYILGKKVSEFEKFSKILQLKILHRSWKLRRCY